MTVIKLKSRLVKSKKACGKENFRNIQIINIAQLLQNKNTTIFINNILKEPQELICDIEIKTCQKAIEFFADKAAERYTSSEYLQLLLDNESNIEFIDQFIISPTHRIEINFHKEKRKKGMLGNEMSSTIVAKEMQTENQLQ